MQLQVKIVARQLGYNFILVSLVFLGVAGCSTPIGVKRVGTKEAHHLLTANVLSAGTPSLHSLQVLSRLDLREQFDDDPQAALAALHTILQSTPDSYRLNNRLFALAELSFFYAEQQRQRPAQDYQCMALKGRPCSSDRRPREETQARAYYLAATVYAYALLFPEDPQSVPLDPADPRLRLASWLVTLPGDLSQRTLTTFTQNQDKLLIQKMEKLPTSVDNMNPSHPFIKTLASIPMAEGVKAHSIIPVLGTGPLSGGNDGIVAYDSAQIDGVESELVVRFGHSIQSHPKAIEEIRRILIEHLNESGRIVSEAENASE